MELAIASVVALSTTILALLLTFRNSLFHLLHLSPETMERLHALLPFVLVLTFYAFLNDVFSAALIGIGRTDVSSAIQTAGQTIAFASSLILLRAGQGVRSLAAGALLSLVFTQIMATLFARRLGGLTLRPGLRFDRLRARNLLRLASTVFATSLAAALFVPLNKLVLSKCVGLSAVPLYDIAFSIGMRVRGLFEMPVRPIMPALSHAVSARNEDLRSAFSRIGKHANRVLALAAIAFVILFVFANPILKIWLRRSFEPTLPGSLRIALAGAFISLLGVPAYYSLLGIGKVSALFWSHIVQSATNLAIVVGTFFLGFQLSVSWLLGASSIAMAASTCFLIVAYTSTLKLLTHSVNPLASSKRRVGPMLAVADGSLSSGSKD